MVDWSKIETFLELADLHLENVPESERRGEADAIFIKVQHQLNRWRNREATPPPPEFA